jgi:putative ABC transport system substrate-binding protein
MRRREFLGVLGGAAASWPFAGRAQQFDGVRRIGYLSGVGAAVTDQRAPGSTLVQALQQLGWTDGRNIKIEYRWSDGTPEQIRKYVAELVALKPDLIFAFGTATMSPLLAATRTIPIVFVQVADPVGAGFVASLARPGANATGIMQFEYSLSGKWLEPLKEIAPGVTRAAVLRDAALSGGVGQFAVIQSVAPALGIDVSPINVGDAHGIERSVAAFARAGSGGLVITASALAAAHGDLIVRLAARYKLPAVYFVRPFVAAGGLASYGPDIDDSYRAAARYVDRILKGEKPADLPVQAPTKYELVINLKTAKALGLTLPPSLVARADEVIE